ncbi:7113_t:CDS:1 [Paraglomus occultum]|uniref:7113_t:CDS:1 n=1 Tax=Paraglomus occultum TaxID=144539 RepID=A0A9N9D3F1_9GLOM|nr:7113_t:CDS:1 [Paraglomus occultum]
MFNVYPDGEHRLEKLYVQEILHKAAINTTGAAIIAVPKTSASDITYDRPTTPPEQMIPEVLSDPPTPISDANKRCLNTGSLLITELEPAVIAAIRRHNLCTLCGEKDHERVACPYKRRLPSASWLNPFITGIRNLNKKPKRMTTMVETIDEEIQLQREEISQLQAQTPQVGIAPIKCSHCLQEGHMEFECRSAIDNE